MNEISERLKKLYENSSARAFAIKVGISPTTFNEYIKNNRMPSIDVLIKIVKATGVSYGWLITGEGDMFANEICKHDIIVSGHTVQIPYFDHVRVSAGYGIEIFNEEPDGVYEMPEKFFNGIGNKKLNCIRVSGDSMYPRFDDGDWIFITPTQSIRSEGIYVVRVWETLLVKKVQWLPNGLKLLSENRDYEPVLLNEDTCPSDQVSIIGKVVLIVSKP